MIHVGTRSYRKKFALRKTINAQIYVRHTVYAFTRFTKKFKVRRPTTKAIPKLCKF